jgi:hypothetical protein
MSEKKTTILKAWPMIKADFAAFTTDPTCWFIDHMEAALADNNLDAIRTLLDIFKIVNLPSEGHHHH